MPKTRAVEAKSILFIGVYWFSSDMLIRQCFNRISEGRTVEGYNNMVKLNLMLTNLHEVKKNYCTPETYSDILYMQIEWSQ